MKPSRLITLFTLICFMLSVNMKESVLRTYHTHPIANKAATVTRSTSSGNSSHFYLSDIEHNCDDDELKSLAKKAVRPDYQVFHKYTIAVIASDSYPKNYLYHQQYTTYFPPEKYIFLQVFRV